MKSDGARMVRLNIDGDGQRDSVTPIFAMLNALAREGSRLLSYLSGSHNYILYNSA